MNTSLFSTYATAINAYLSSQYDSTYKTWNELVTVFFEFNIDPFVSSATNLAKAFDNASHPTYLRIHAKSIDSYFETFKFSTATLRKEDFEELTEFVDDSDGLRLTFETFRTIVYTKGTRNLIDMFNFVGKVYQLHVRYGTAMAGRSRRNTHWTIIERVKGFTEAMQPHIDFAAARAIAKHNVPKEKFLTMDTQPKVYSILRGSYKDIVSRLEADKRIVQPKKKNVKPSPAKLQYVEEPLTPIYETVLDCAETEIGYLLAYIDEKHARPYRKQQISKDSKSKSLVNTKEHIRMCKSHILIDCSVGLYDETNIINDINEVRYRLQLGKKVVDSKTILSKYSVKPLPRTEVDINTFSTSDGQHLDSEGKITLAEHVPDDMVTLITRKHTRVAFESKARRPTLKIETADLKTEVFQFGEERSTKSSKRATRKILTPKSTTGTKRGKRDVIDLTNEPEILDEDTQSETYRTEYAQSDPEGSVYGSETESMPIDDDYNTPITPRSAKARRYFA